MAGPIGEPTHAGALKWTDISVVTTHGRIRLVETATGAPVLDLVPWQAIALSETLAERGYRAMTADALASERFGGGR